MTTNTPLTTKITVLETSGFSHRPFTFTTKREKRASLGILDHHR